MIDLFLRSIKFVSSCVFSESVVKCLWILCGILSVLQGTIRSRYISLLSLSFSFTLCSAGTAKSTIRQILLFFFFFCCCCWQSLGLVVWPWLDEPFVYQNPEKYYSSHLLWRILGYTYIVCIVKFQLLAQFPVDHVAHSVVSSLCANLLHSLIIWLIVSSLSPHNLHLLFCCILSILVLDIVFMILFCVAIRRDSVSLLRFPFLSHIHIFSSEISFVCRLNCPYSCFPHFYFLIILVQSMIVLSVLFLAAVISLPPHFLCSLLVVIFLLFLTYSLSTSPLGCRALCIDIGFLIPRSIIIIIRVFHISVSWWSFAGHWVTANILKSPGLFSVFWPFSIMLFGWSPLGR